MNGHEYVDLGLSVKWATCNVGATSPEEYGDYYAWGETSTKRTYSWSTYKWCKGSYDTQTKYCTQSNYGRVDNNTRLYLTDDAARANWGSVWRMPTDAEWTELRTKCTWTWTTRNGVKGYTVKSNINGNSIFLPAAGRRLDVLGSAGDDGNYWSSSLAAYGPNFACYVSFGSDDVDRYFNLRYCGFSVRPVLSDQAKEEQLRQEQLAQAQREAKQNGTHNGHNWVDLGLSVKWATCNVGATKPEEYGNYYAWGETKPNDYYSFRTYKWCKGSDEILLTKYSTRSYYGRVRVDNKTTLDLADDAARANWGGQWRMPIFAEWTELCENCEWTWTSDYNGTGVAGLIVTSNINGNSIFLPAAGYRYDDLYGAGSNGRYWSSSLDTYDPHRACYVASGPDYALRDYYGRCCGFSVRPVLFGE